MKSAEHSNKEASILGNIGVAYYYMQNYQKSLNYFKQTLLIAEELEYLHLKGTSLYNIGDALNKLGECSRGRKYALQGIAILTKVDHRMASKLKEQMKDW